MFAVYASCPSRDDPLASLVVGERPESKVPEGWVRVKVSHASLNRHDLFTLRGITAHSDPIPFPIILGNDGAGVLDDGTPIVIYPVMGSDDWRDDETLDPHWHIFSERVPGTFADYVAVPARNAIPLPDGLSALEASVLGTAWLTAYRALFTKSALKPGETLLVQGASGGMSTALVQLGRAAGFEVWTTSRSATGRKLAEKLGANRTFDANETLPRKVQAVIDNIGPGVLAALDGIGRPWWDACRYGRNDRPGSSVAAPANAQRTNHRVRIDHGDAPGHEEHDSFHRRRRNQAGDRPGFPYGTSCGGFPRDVEG